MADKELGFRVSAKKGDLSGLDALEKKTDQALKNIRKKASEQVKKVRDLYIKGTVTDPLRAAGREDEAIAEKVKQYGDKIKDASKAISEKAVDKRTDAGEVLRKTKEIKLTSAKITIQKATIKGVSPVAGRGGGAEAGVTIPGTQQGMPSGGLGKFGKAIPILGAILGVAGGLYGAAAGRTSAFRNVGQAQSTQLLGLPGFGGIREKGIAAGFYGGGGFTTGAEKAAFMRGFAGQQYRMGRSGAEAAFNQLGHLKGYGFDTGEIGRMSGVMGRFGQGGANRIAGLTGFGIQQGFSRDRIEEFLNSLEESITSAIMEGGEANASQIEGMIRVLSGGSAGLTAKAGQLIGGAGATGRRAGMLQGGRNEAVVFQALMNAYPGKSIEEVAQIASTQPLTTAKAVKSFLTQRGQTGFQGALAFGNILGFNATPTILQEAFKSVDMMKSVQAGSGKLSPEKVKELLVGSTPLMAAERARVAEENAMLAGFNKTINDFILGTKEATSGFQKSISQAGEDFYNKVINPPAKVEKYAPATSQTVEG